MNSVDYQKLFNSLMIIRDYCQRHECNSKCDFFKTGGGCYLRSGIPPSNWYISNTIIKGMNCEEFTPKVIEEENNDTPIEEVAKDANH